MTRLGGRLTLSLTVIVALSMLKPVAGAAQGTMYPHTESLSGIVILGVYRFMNYG